MTNLVVVSHHHADHYGEMAEVIRQFRPGVFLASNSPHSSEHYLKLLELVRDQGIRAIGPAASARRIKLGPVVLTVLPQASHDPDEENNHSVGLRLPYGAFSVLLPKDAEGLERRWWERNVPILCANALVLKLAHHGSRNGTDTTWLELVRPRLAVASLGKDNEFDHLHPETLALLQRRKVPLLRTDRDGTIVVQSDGVRWGVAAPRHTAHEMPIATADHLEKSRAKHHSKPKDPAARVNINTATEDELRTIPGVGPVLARRIIAKRPYRTIRRPGAGRGDW